MDQILFYMIDDFERTSVRTESLLIMSSNGKNIPHISFQLLPERLAHITPGPGTGDVHTVM